MNADAWLEANTPRVRSLVKPARFEHILRVTRLCRELAAEHGLNLLRATQAGLLHDSAKNLPKTKMMRLLKQEKADPWERAMPGLWHAVAGVAVARDRFGVRNTEVLKAIRGHSTGLPKATPLQQCLVVADRTEPGRQERGLAALRKLAMRDLAEAYRRILQEKIRWLIEHDKVVHPRAVTAWNTLERKH